MKAMVVYASKTGNTRKIAEAMATTLACPCASIDSDPTPTGLDTLFLGAAVYATHDHGLDPAMVGFIRRLRVGAAKTIALFCTGFSADAVARMRGLLAGAGHELAAESFHCEGRFLLFKHGHPDKADIEAAGAFAKRIAE